MSLYPQNQHYGQPLYPTSYSHPGPHNGYYQPPPLAPAYHVDAATFRRDYAARLAELNVNSRPMIQNLSMLAQEFSRFVEIVAQCLEAHIRRVSSLPFSTIFHGVHSATWLGGVVTSFILYVVPRIMYLVLVFLKLEKDTASALHHFKQSMQLPFPSICLCSGTLTNISYLGF